MNKKERTHKMNEQEKLYYFLERIGFSESSNELDELSGELLNYFSDGYRTEEGKLLYQIIRARQGDLRKIKRVQELLGNAKQIIDMKV